MRRHLVVASLVIMTLAGCADQQAPATVDDIDVADVQPFEDIVQSRPNLTAVTIHETSQEGSEPQPYAITDEERPDRDATLSYHGIGEVHDEWGTLLPAHVFRYDPLHYVITEIKISLDGEPQFDGEYREFNLEYYFDTADGRFLGSTDLDRGVRSFASPDLRLPFAWGYEGNLMLAMVAHMQGDLTTPIEYEAYGYNFTYWMNAYDGERPLDGTCDVYREHTRIEGPGIEPGDEPEKKDGHRSLVCFDDSMVPVWHWSGNATQGSFSLERRGDGFSWPGPTGDIQPPDHFPVGPMEPVDPLLPGQDPLYAPPSRDGIDWAGMVRDRVEAVQAGVPYQRFDLAQGPAYASSVSTGWPPMTFGIGGVLPPGFESLAHVEESAWLHLKADDILSTFVHTVRQGEGSYYVADTQGFERSDDGYFPYPTREALGDVVHAAEVQGRIGDMAPEQPRMVDWFVWPDFGSEYTPEAWWSVASHCFEEAEDPRFVIFDGKDGHLMAAGSHITSQNGCAMGGFEAMIAGEHVTVHPATPDRPFPLVLGQDGLALPLLPEADAYAGQAFDLV